MQLRDSQYFWELSFTRKYPIRFLTFSYLCLFDLRTGRVLDYKYFFGPEGVYFDGHNKCKNESRSIKD